MAHNFGVIFDMDGVLVDSNPIHKESLNIFFEKHDKHISEDFLTSKVYGRTNGDWIPAVFGDISSEDVDELADEKEKLFRGIFDPQKAMVKGLREFLQRLRQEGVKIAVATSAPVENADFILSALSIQDLFDAILDSSHVSEGKPEPEIYLKAADALGFSAEECVVFEDSLAGVESARRAKAKVIGVTTTHSAKELSDCDKVIDDFTSLGTSNLSALFE